MDVEAPAADKRVAAETQQTVLHLEVSNVAAVVVDFVEDTAGRTGTAAAVVAGHPIRTAVESQDMTDIDLVREDSLRAWSIVAAAPHTAWWEHHKTTGAADCRAAGAVQSLAGPFAHSSLLSYLSFPAHEPE